ncbi:hypothetical protein IU459_31710 [Nocardia amamiensis]|uniref:Uncharacterized protein n=2 Tax=Nocardia amamiensis TaxID=404578 RepID=A0ABS0CZR0_9NOCA|nr:hypothetical protein [Nocardia amamiensis]
MPDRADHATALFAAGAGVSFEDLEQVLSPEPLGVVLGLAVGKTAREVEVWSAVSWPTSTKASTHSIRWKRRPCLGRFSN